MFAHMVTPPDTPRTSYGHPTDKELDTTDKEPDTTDKEPGILRTRNRTSYGHPTDKEPDITGHEGTTPLCSIFWLHFTL